MGEVRLLDCTLRDGGYLNDWKFNHNNIVSIFERIVDAGTDVIEIGFLDERRSFDIDRTIMPDTDCVEKIFGELNRKGTKVFGMIDYGTCSLKNIRPCSESYLDGIRVIFKKHLRREALEFCRELKRLGYCVFAQLVSVTSYTDEEMLDLIRLANEAGPDAVSMVDTYGLMHQNNLMHYFNLLNAGLNPSMMLGYHGHNNFQMGYANCIAMLQQSALVQRMLLVDGSLYGMGKSAGNAPIELVAMFMNRTMGKHYHISQYLEAIDANIMQFYTPATWGYNMFFYIAGFNDCHPNYVKQLMNKRTLSVKQINELLGHLEGEKKLLYDEAYMETLYVRYQEHEINDDAALAALKKLLSGRKILLIGPGSTMQTEKEKILKYIEKESPLTVAINYIPDYIEPDCVFVSNSKRYVQMASKLSRVHFTVIATSNVTRMHDDFDYTVNYSKLIDRNAKIIDNSFVMLLKLMKEEGIHQVSACGFDGYSSDEKNYFNASMEYDFVKKMADELNNYTNHFLEASRGDLTVQFITDTKYGLPEE